MFVFLLVVKMRKREDKTEFKGRTWDLLLPMEVILRVQLKGA